MICSVCKSKVQTLVSFILGSLQVLQLLFLGHSIPFRIARLVTPDVVRFSQAVEAKITNRYSEQSPVTAGIVWRIV